jgi:hypothetical protein
MQVFRHEKIDDLRALLGFEDRSAVSMAYLEGIVETTTSESSIRTHEPSDDIALVFVGPKDKLTGERRVLEDGSIVYTIKMPRSA